MGTQTNSQLFEIAERIKEMREILGFTVTEMAEAAEVTIDDYIRYESGEADLPFSLDLAPKFKNKIAEPYWVRYEYSEAQQDSPIHLTKHSGQEYRTMSNSTRLPISIRVSSYSETSCPRP